MTDCGMPHKQCKMIKIDSQLAFAIEHAGIEISHFKANLFEQPGEKSIEFVAKSAAFVD